MLRIDTSFLTFQYLIDHALNLLGTALTFVLGFWTARHLQDRDVKQRQKGIALALLEEVIRIGTEIGSDDEFGYLQASGTVVPTVHPWVHNIIADAARTDPTIVGGFMRLDRKLDNLRWARENYEGARERAGEAAEIAEADPETVATAEDLPESIERTMEARHSVTVTEQNLRQAESRLKIVDRGVRDELDALDILLTKAGG